MRLEDGLVFPLGHADERRCRRRRDVPQATRVPAGARPAVRAPVGREPRDDAGGARPDRGRPRDARWAREPRDRPPPVRGGRLRRQARPGGDGAAFRSPRCRRDCDVRPRRADRQHAAGHPAGLPQGNYIRASDERPFLQIGESKYGKFLLDVAILAHTDLVTSTKIALGSMMSTARANVSVGPPYDAGVYRTGTFALDEHRFTADSPVLDELREVWERNILRAVAELPDVELSELSDDTTPVSRVGAE